MKSEPARTVVAAIRKVLRGEVHISERMASAVVTKFVQGTVDPPPSRCRPSATVNWRSSDATGQARARARSPRK